MLRTVAFILLVIVSGSAFAQSVVQSLPPPGGAAIPPPIIDPSVPVVAAPPPKIWSGGFDFGINGVEGNSQNFKFGVTSNAKRDTPTNVFTADLIYAFGHANNIRTENRFIGRSRFERKFGTSAWSWFVSDEVEYDQFKNFDIRVAAHTGTGYTWWKSDQGEFKTRLGMGTSRKIGSPENHFRVEMLLGSNFEVKLTERQKFITSIEVFPNVDRFEEFRAESRAAWEILLDPATKMLFKVGLVERYDSAPNGRKPNDFEYFANLGWKF
jgi:hypothetical protein